DPESLMLFRRYITHFGDPDAPNLVSGWTLYDEPDSEIRKAFAAYLRSLAETVPRSMLLGTPSAGILYAFTEFREVVYPNPRAAGPGGDSRTALYTMLDASTCLFARVGPGRYYWGDSACAVHGILEQEPMDPEDTIFYDATLGGRVWLRATLTREGDEYVVRIESGVRPDSHWAELVTKEMEGWIWLAP
ncbi:MAG: hypothetical protein AAB671_02495, partial [Patescibacteria group bacterium]